jgi:hypothetical protein
MTLEFEVPKVFQRKSQTASKNVTSLPELGEDWGEGAKTGSNVLNWLREMITSGR